MKKYHHKPTLGLRSGRRRLCVREDGEGRDVHDSVGGGEKVPGSDEGVT